MNIDFFIYTPPKVNYDPISLWGEVVYIPKRVPLDKQKQRANNNSYFNCYKVSHESDVVLTLEDARLDTYGLPIQAITESRSTKETEPTDYEVEYNIPCLFLNSMVNSEYLVIYFHASGEDIKLAYPFLNHLRNICQINVLALEYPGYSIYRGTPRVSRINQDALAVYDYMLNQIGFEEKNVVLLGRSIGSGTAIELASKRKPGALGLISPFSSIKNLAKDFVGGWSSYLVSEQYNNVQNIRKVCCPTFIVHGKADTFIPHHNSIELSNNCKSKLKLLLPEKMTHASFDYYLDLSNPLREFLLDEGMNFYKQGMDGPTMPGVLFKNPQFL